MRQAIYDIRRPLWRNVIPVLAKLYRARAATTKAISVGAVNSWNRANPAGQLLKSQFPATCEVATLWSDPGDKLWRVGTVSSRAKQTGKHGGSGTPLKRSLRAELEKRPQTQRRMKSHNKIQKRMSPSLSETSFLGDSALPEAAAKGFRRCQMFIDPPPPSPEPQKKPQLKSTPAPPASKTTDMAALVLTVLVRMNKRETKIHDIFDIVVRLNRRHQKHNGDACVTRQITTLKRRMAPSIPRLQDLVEYYSGMSYAVLLRFVRHHAFIVAFPFMLLHLAFQFPSILATILTVARGSWGDALFTRDMYFLNAFHRWVMFFRPLFPTF